MSRSYRLGGHLQVDKCVQSLLSRKDSQKPVLRTKVGSGQLDSADVEVWAGLYMVLCRHLKTPFLSFFL